MGEKDCRALEGEEGMLFASSDADDLTSSFLAD